MKEISANLGGTVGSRYIADITTFLVRRKVQISWRYLEQLIKSAVAIRGRLYLLGLGIRYAK